MNPKKIFQQLSLIAMLLTVGSGFEFATSGAVAGEIPAKKVTQEDETGTNPAGFANKFTPYYTNTELENGLEIQQLMLSGSIAFNKDVSVTYDLPMGEQIDYSGLPAPGNIHP